MRAVIPYMLASMAEPEDNGDHRHWHWHAQRPELMSRAHTGACKKDGPGGQLLAAMSAPFVLLGTRRYAQ